MRVPTTTVNLIFITPKEKLPYTLAGRFPTLPQGSPPPPVPGNHWSAFCLNGFACPGGSVSVASGDGGLGGGFIYSLLLSASPVGEKPLPTSLPPGQRLSRRRPLNVSVRWPHGSPMPGATQRQKHSRLRGVLSSVTLPSYFQVFLTLPACLLTTRKSVWDFRLN